MDDDGLANDTFSFTLVATGTGPNPRAFNQGIDTGFGQINGVTFSVTNVVGTSDQGATVVFDGFTGAGAGSGGNGTLDRSVDIITSLGTNTATFNQTTNGFQFFTQDFDFASAQGTVQFTNSSGTFGSIVARQFDFQFRGVAAIPEPSGVALIGLVGSLVALRRTRK